MASASSVREAHRRANVRVSAGSSPAGSWYWSKPIRASSRNAPEQSGQGRRLLALDEREQPAGERLEHLALDARVGVEQPVELALGEHEDAQRRLGLHRRHALRVLDERNLTEEVHRPVD